MKVSCIIGVSIWLGGGFAVSDEIDDFDLDSTETVSKGGLEWRIHYNDDSSSSFDSDGDGIDESSHYVSLSNAQDVVSFIGGLYDRQITDMGFTQHWSTTTDDDYFDVLLFDFDGIGESWFGYYDQDLFALNTDRLSDPPGVTDRKVTAHELFHSIQSGYARRAGSTSWNTWGTVVAEGHTRALDDRWESDFDWNNNGNSLYLDGAAKAFLEGFNVDADGDGVSDGVHPGYISYDFWKIGTDEDRSTFGGDYPYSAGIFWSYLCEQLGNEINALDNGYDWIRKFYEKAESMLNDGEDVDQEILTNAAIQSFSRGAGEDFGSMYFDFAICNYARDYDQSALDFDTRYRKSNLVPRYEYRDEKEVGPTGQQNYGSVSGAVNTSTTTTGASFTGESVDPNSAKYYEWDLIGNLNAVECEVIGVRIESDDCADICIIGITEAGNIVDLRKTTGTEASRSYFVSHRTALADRIGKIAVVVAGKSNGVDGLNITFARDEPVLKVTHPSQSNLAYPGPYDDPENFLVRLIVEGPADLTPEGLGNLSIQGLIQNDFEVAVNSLPATVKSSAYVGGEYWLLVEAPVQTADGLYSLEVGLCSGMKSDVNSLSVLYGDYMFRHVVCMDVSGSMDSPSTKLEASKQSALFYVDTVRDDHRIGLVSFSGDGVSSTQDALAAGGQLFGANLFTRGLIKVGINNYTAGGFTSIGDGLDVSQDIIDADTTSGELIDTILLLSDGAQNEAALWGEGQPVTERFVGSPGKAGNETIINTLSFGADADTNLMQDIALSTDGDHDYIEVNTGAIARGSTNTGSMFLNLAQAYLSGTEKAQQLDRLGCVKDSVESGGNLEVAVDLVDAQVEDGMIYIYWDGKSGALDVTLTGPAGTEITAAEADIFPPDYTRNERHKVWQMNVDLKQGKYTFTIENRTGSEVPFFAGISGRPVNQVACELAFSSYLRSNLTHRSGGHRQRFGIGQPVTLLAFLTDRDGIVKEAEVAVEVTLPTGEVACGPIYMFDDGAHGDGAAGDGVYGAFFRQTLWGQSVGTDIDRNGQSVPPDANGTYRVRVSATGEANDQSPFVRDVNGVFSVYEESLQGEPVEGFDEDLDGLPNSWEVSQGLDPKTKNDQLDPDEDGLTNMDEYHAGTLALNADTDGGGESDGAEVSRGRCPLDGLDDAIRSSNQFAVLSNGVEDDHFYPLLPSAGLNRVRYPQVRSWEFVELQRALDPDGPWAGIGTIDMDLADEAIYEDAGLVPGTTYYYRMRATRPTVGAVTPWSNLTKGIPIDNQDPVAKTGSGPVTKGDVLNGQLVATDADNGATLSYVLDAPVAGLTLNVDGSYSFDSSDEAYPSLSEGETLKVVANWTVTDEHGATASSTLTITVTGSAQPPVRIINVVGEGIPGELTSFIINFTSVAGRVYAVERSRDLVNWEVLASVAGEEDSTEYADADPILDGSVVFYRVREAE